MTAPTLKLKATAPYQTIIANSGTSYTSDVNSIITGIAIGDVIDLLKAGCEELPMDGRDNLTATTDPGTGNDNTQNYAPGSFWFNTTTSRTWHCISAATGAAVWALSGIVPGTGVHPANMLTQFGGSVFGANFSYFAEEGNLYRNIANPIAGNAADTTDDILGGVVIPAGALDAAGRGLCITAQGITGATTNNKRFKLFINPTMSGQTVTNGVISGGTVSAGTPITDSGAWVNGTTPNNAAGWQAMANLFKYGANGSNTQYAQGGAILGTLHGGIQAPQFLTLSESAAINIVVTGSSYTTGAANDVKMSFLEVNAMN